MAFGRQIALCVAALAVAVGLLGCGSSNNDGTVDVTGAKFTPQDEGAFNAKLAVVKGYVDDGDCVRAGDALKALETAVGEVPQGTDEQLKSDLLDLLGRLGDQLDSQCVETSTSTSSSSSSSSSTTDPTSTTDSTATPTTTETTTSTDTTSTDTSSTDTKPTKPEPPTPPVNPGGGTQNPPPSTGEKNPDTGGITPGGGNK